VKRRKTTQKKQKKHTKKKQKRKKTKKRKRKKKKKQKHTHTTQDVKTPRAKATKKHPTTKEGEQDDI